jgi:putrescine importer
MSVARRIGGAALDFSLSIVLLIGSVGSGITGQIGASRLLYGMGRDSIIPKKIFGHLNKKYLNPDLNVIIIGALALLGAIILNYEDCALLINFGAFFAFMGVNLASSLEYFFRVKEKTVRMFLLDFVPPAIGFIFCLIIWFNLPARTFIVGGTWMLAGMLYLAIRTKGFREKMAMIDFTE